MPADAAHNSRGSSSCAAAAIAAAAAAAGRVKKEVHQQPAPRGTWQVGAMPRSPVTRQRHGTRVQQQQQDRSRLAGKDATATASLLPGLRGVPPGGGCEGEAVVVSCYGWLTCTGGAHGGGGGGGG